MAFVAIPNIAQFRSTTFWYSGVGSSFRAPEGIGVAGLLRVTAERADPDGRG
jgi:hypothetical protein